MAASCLEARVEIDRVEAVRLDDGRVRVVVALRNTGDDDAPNACVQVIWRDTKGPFDQRLSCMRRYLHGGGLTPLCPGDSCPRSGVTTTESRGPIARAGVSIEVRVTRSGDLYAMDDYDEVRTLPSP